MKKGSIIENVPIVDIGAKGKSVARHDQFVIFTEDAVPGDVADIKLLRKKKGFGEGIVTEIKKFSPDRVQPLCSHFSYCGGCSWQNINYQTQLKFKEKSVVDAMQRIGKIDVSGLLPIIGSTRTEYYRNRLDFAFSDRRWVTNEEMHDPNFVHEPGLGFHVPGKFDKVLDVKRCYLQMDPSNRIRLAIRQYAIENNLSFFHLRNQVGLLRSLIIRTTTIGELMVLIAFHRNDEEDIKGLLDFIKNKFPEITSLYYIINPKANDTMYDLEHILYYGREYTIEKLNGISYRTGPKSFFQTNPFQAEVLFQKAKEMAELKGDEIIYDLYTGVGSIALYLADKAKKVVGIETIEEAIEFAKVNAEDNNIGNASFFAGDVKYIFNDEFIEANGKPDVIFTDPPRVGMDKDVVEQILKLAPKKIVYVSCNPATQARDIDWMREQYNVSKLQPVDMFPHTYHVENIAILERK